MAEAYDSLEEFEEALGRYSDEEGIRSFNIAELKRISASLCVDYLRETMPKVTRLVTNLHALCSEDNPHPPPRSELVKLTFIYSEISTKLTQIEEDLREAQEEEVVDDLLLSQLDVLQSIKYDDIPRELRNAVKEVAAGAGRKYKFKSENGWKRLQATLASEPVKHRDMINTLSVMLEGVRYTPRDRDVNLGDPGRGAPGSRNHGLGLRQ